VTGLGSWFVHRRFKKTTDKCFESVWYVHACLVPPHTKLQILFQMCSDMMIVWLCDLAPSLRAQLHHTICAKASLGL
jgi:hypothetical protein